MKIIKVPISQLVLWDKNPRGMKRADYERLKRQIKKLGFYKPLIVCKEGNDYVVLGGNMRLRALRELGYKEVEVSVVDCRTEAEKIEYSLSDNDRIGYYERDKLAELVYSYQGEINPEDYKIDIQEPIELNDILERYGIGRNREIDEIPILDNKTALTKPGEIYQLGNHYLMCGDSTNLDDVKKLMKDKKATLGFTSPPYWVGKEYETQKSIKEIDEFIRKACQSYNFAVKKDESRIVINTGAGFTTSFEKGKKRQLLLLIDKWANNFYELGWNLRHIRHWIKEGQLKSLSPKADMIDQHCEFLGTFENSNGKDIKFEDKLNDEDINIIEVFYNREGKSFGQYKVMEKWALRSYWDDIKGNANQNGHCASFPAELVFRHLLLYTKKGDLILDLFGGAGTTLIACEVMKRQCMMMEIMPIYCDLIIKRFSEFAGIPEEEIRKTRQAAK